MAENIFDKLKTILDGVLSAPKSNDLPVEMNSKTLLISAKENDIVKYNIKMSDLAEVLEPLAEKFGGSGGVGPFLEPGKPSFMAEFNDVASANAFVKEVLGTKAIKKFAPLTIKPA